MYIKYLEDAKKYNNSAVALQALEEKNFIKLEEADKEKLVEALTHHAKGGSRDLLLQINRIAQKNLQRDLVEVPPSLLERMAKSLAQRVHPVPVIASSATAALIATATKLCETTDPFEIASCVDNHYLKIGTAAFITAFTLARYRSKRNNTPVPIPKAPVASQEEKKAEISSTIETKTGVTIEDITHEENATFDYGLEATDSEDE